MGYELVGKATANEHTFQCDGAPNGEPCHARVRTLRWEHSKRIAPRGWRGVQGANSKHLWYCPPCFDEVVAIDPVPCRGAQGLWFVPEDVERIVVERWEAARAA